MKPGADLVLHNATVLTMEPGQPEAHGVAIGGGRILAVGSSAEVRGWASADTRVIDLGGKTLLPGFIDAHSHFASTGVRMRELDFWAYDSLEKVLDAVRDATARTPPGQWILGRNWDESRWRERRYINRADLDFAAPNHPVILARVDYHMLAANSRALELIEIPLGTPGVVTNADGRPTGELKEQAAEHAWSSLEPSVDAIEAGLGAVATEAHRLGITSVHDTVDAREVRAYLRAKTKGGLRMRVCLMPREAEAAHLLEAGLATGLGDEWLKLGPIKLFSDGSFGSRTAALHEPFSDEAGNGGMLMHGEAQFFDLVERIHAGAFQLAIHAIGDRAIDHVLDAYASGLSRAPRREHRHRIEHFELPTEEALGRAKRFGIVASMQPNFIGQWSLLGGMYQDRLGKERLRRNNPLARVAAAGIPLAFGSDHMPFGPLYGIHWAVNAPFEDQRLAVEEALKASTLGAAYASHEEHLKGSIAPGKLADLVVLGKDPRQLPKEIADTGIAMTVLNGEIVFKAHLVQ